MQFEAILWDNDGVLVDTERLYYRACRQVLKGEGITLREEDFRRHFLADNEGIHAVCRLHDVPRDRVDFIRLNRSRVYGELLKKGVKTMSGIKNVLSGLSGRIRMAVVTSCRSDHFELMHKQTGVSDFFEFCLTREQYRQSKPHPEPYLLACDRLNLSPERVLVIEDSPRGLMAAKAAGLTCWIYPSSFFKSYDWGPADRILNNLEEIPLFLEDPPMVAEG